MDDPEPFVDDKFERRHNYKGERLIDTINDDLMPDNLIPLEDELEGISDTLTPGFLKDAEDDVWNKLATLIDTVYPAAGVHEFLSKPHSWWEYFKYFRWVINLFFYAIPWIVVSSVLIVLNFVFNIWLNQWWSNMNPFLIADTVYLVYQTLVSWPLIMELPIWIH